MRLRANRFELAYASAIWTIIYTLNTYIEGRHKDQRHQRGERQQGLHLQPVQERQPELRFMRVEERGRDLHHLHVERRQ